MISQSVMPSEQDIALANELLETARKKKSKADRLLKRSQQLLREAATINLKAKRLLQGQLTFDMQE